MALPVPPRSILIIQTAFTGDVVLATPVIERLHRCYPDAAIDFLLRKGNEGLLQGHPHLRQVLVRDKRQGKLKSLVQTLRQVRAARYDLVVNLHRFASSGIVAALSKGQQICGFDKNPFSWRYDHRVPHVIGVAGVHEVDRNLSTIAHLTAGPDDPMRLYPSAADFAKVPQGLAYVCIAPTSVWFTKQWPAERWTALIQALPAGLRVYLLGAPSDQATCARIAAASGHPDIHNMCGQLNFLQSAALMSQAQMNYVNDSAPLHFASAMQAPVTAVFCSTVPDFGFGPRSPQGRIVAHPGQLDCRPCGLHGHRACPKGHFKCADIPTALVLGEGWGK